MSDAQPPKYILEGLEKQDPATLRRIARIAEDMADQLEAELEEQLEEDEEEAQDILEKHDVNEDPEDFPHYDEVPANASISVKPIDGRYYIYFQWREGGEMQSQYSRPVQPKPR